MELPCAGGGNLISIDETLNPRDPLGVAVPLSRSIRPDSGTPAFIGSPVTKVLVTLIELTFGRPHFELNTGKT